MTSTHPILERGLPSNLDAERAVLGAVLHRWHPDPPEAA
jgi:hypothetical protein